MIAKPRIVIAGQLPPPMGGQNAMILDLLARLRATGMAEVDHLAFGFTPDTRSARKGQLAKVIELIRVIARLIRLRLRGAIDLTVYPPGGPQTVPLFRDLLLLPIVRMVSRDVVLHFHAAGLADSLERGNPLARAVAWIAGKCRYAVVMTNFNRRDPGACGIPDIHVVPHSLEDRFEQSRVRRHDPEIRVLAMGHLCGDKGTPNLIQAVSGLKSDFPELILELAGEPLAPYSESKLRDDILRFGMQDHVRLPGVVSGEAKYDAFGRADIFIFPTVAPYESFGLVLVEAMMWGLPVVASEWRGNSDVVAGSKGAMLFQPADSSEALKTCLGEMLRSRSEWPEMGRSNRDTFLTHYEPSANRENLPELLIRLAGEARATNQG